MYLSTDYPISPKYNSLLYDLNGIFTYDYFLLSFGNHLPAVKAEPSSMLLVSL